MPDSHSIKDLPDSAQIDQGKNYLVSGEWLVIIFETLKQLWRGENIGKGPNIRLRQNGLGGLTITGASQKTSVVASIPNPFQVTVRADPSNPALFQASVYWASDLLKSLQPSDNQTITGMANVPAPIGDGNPNWFSVLPNDLIWLEVTGTPLSSSYTAAIASYGLGSSPTFVPTDPAGDGSSGQQGCVLWTLSTDGSGNTVYTQTNSRIPIAQTQAGESGQPVLTQMLTSHLLLKNLVITGVPAIYPTPWAVRSSADVNPIS